jgi:hypothetical protein
MKLCPISGCTLDSLPVEEFAFLDDLLDTDDQP